MPARSVGRIFDAMSSSDISGTGSLAEGLRRTIGANRQAAQFAPIAKVFC
ncbi:hypothetical protein OAA19_00100 [Rubripirellula sp.]|nr:hypothetical protein [Rubripirellula sp.]MDB4338487.1 hypothetical protein [Rubripirellula sp.]